MKQFVKTPGGVDQYECNVKYIPGHNPDLVLRSGSEETARVDLTKYKTQEALHELFTTRGIARRPAAEGASHSEL